MEALSLEHELDRSSLDDLASDLYSLTLSLERLLVLSDTGVQVAAFQSSV